MIILRTPLGEAPRAVDGAILLIAVAEPVVVPETVSPPPETEIAAQIEAPQVEAPSVDVQPDMAAASQACTLTEDVQAALRVSEAIPEAIQKIPATARSVANSLMLWDGTWARAAAIGGEAVLAPIQQVVKARILLAPAACRSVLITGPRLMLVPDGAGSVVLAFGSGVWNWNQVLG